MTYFNDVSKDQLLQLNRGGSVNDPVNLVDISQDPLTNAKNQIVHARDEAIKQDMKVVKPMVAEQRIGSFGFFKRHDSVVKSEGQNKDQLVNSEAQKKDPTKPGVP